MQETNNTFFVNIGRILISSNTLGGFQPPELNKNSESSQASNQTATMTNNYLSNCLSNSDMLAVFPIEFPEIARQSPGHVLDNCRNIPGTVLEISRASPGDVMEKSWTSMWNIPRKFPECS